MSMTSKIVLSALLVGMTVPAFAQGGTVAAQKPAIATSSASVHTVATSAEPTKAGGAVSTPSVGAGVAASTKPAAKPEIGKTEIVKPAVTTGISKPSTPSVQSTTTLAPKTN